jgi:hypothetical protein
VSATSLDGLNWTAEAGLRVSGGIHPAIITLPTGGFRMIYGLSDQFPFRERLGSAISTDGLTFVIETGTRLSPLPEDNGVVGAPNVIRLPNGQLRMYYINGLAGGGILSATSADEGLTWSREPGTRAGNGVLFPNSPPSISASDPAVVLLPDGRFKMFFLHRDGGSTATGQNYGIYSGTSTDGLSFTLDSGVRIVGNKVPEDVNGLAEPFPVLLSDGRIRLYFSGVGAAQFDLLSALSAGVATGDSAIINFAQIGNGTGIVSELVLSNPSASRTAAGKMEIFGDDGTPLAMGFAGSTSKSQVDFSIPPLGEITIATDGQGTVAVGSAQVTADNTVGGVIRFNLSGVGIAGVGESQPLSGFITPARRKLGQINTGVAVRNTEAVSVTLNLTLRNAQGQVIPNGLRTIQNLAAGGHLARFLEELFPTAALDDFVGTLTVEAVSGRIAGTTLELGTAAGQFTTLPVTPLKP